ncbi:HEAT repeat domain-containing protein [Massilia sp. DWR3-1-1]|uniref:HEAT repeat domain-containing protein n=1 Tax=Massilia sp. DWR3-1-1 TaxID=2804559 RepID=UPI003CE9B124
MQGSDLLALLLRHTLAVLLLLLVLRALRSGSAAGRVFAARCGLAALVLMPLAWVLVPAVPLRLPYAWSALLAPPAALPPLQWLAGAPPASAGFEAPFRAAALGWGLLCIYGLVVLLHAVRMGWALWQLRRISARAQVVLAPPWCAALQGLRGQYGMRRPVRLLVSDQIASPLSWGVRQPVIVLDRNSLAAAAPTAVLSHELAHVRAHDWPLMLLARAMLAWYWWHPLMHLLVRAMEHDVECAADDAALRAGVQPSQYAHTLLQVSRHAFAAPHARSLGQRIAGRGDALTARIAALLEARRARAPVTDRAWAAGAVLTCLLIAALSGLALKGEHVVWPDQLWQAPEARRGQDVSALLDRLDNPNFTQLAVAMRAEDFALRHALEVESFRQRAAIPPLILALQDRRPVVRRLGAWALGEMRFPETSPALAVLLSDPVPAVRAEAVGALGDMGEVRWLPVLHAMLRDPEPAVRSRVAHALGDLAEQASLPALEAARHDADSDVAGQVAWALRELR